MIDHPEKRPLYILYGQTGGKYVMVAKNENTVYYVDCGGMMGDPFVNISANEGRFTISHYGGSAWRWAREITYNYSKEEDEWFLAMDRHESFHAFEPEDVEVTTETKRDFGRIRFEDFNIYSEQEE